MGQGTFLFNNTYSYKLLDLLKSLLGEGEKRIEKMPVKHLKERKENVHINKQNKREYRNKFMRKKQRKKHEKINKKAKGKILNRYNFIY